MTRIIQRFFVVLAFTGFFLSTAHETSASEVSDSTTQSSKTFTSAPESSFNSEKTQLYSSTDKVDDNKNASVTEAAEAKSSSHSKIAATDAAHAFSKVSVTNFSLRDADDITTVSSMSGKNTDNAHDDEKSSHSALFKSALHDESSVAGAFLMRPDMSEKSIKISSKMDSKGKEQSDKISETKTLISETEVTKMTTEPDLKQPEHASSPEHVSIDSGQNTVPSKELVYNSSDVDRNRTPEDIASTAANKVENEEIENNDSKRLASRKRTLNDTSTIVNSTTIINSKKTSSAATSTTSLTHDLTISESKEQADEKEYVTILPPKYENEAAVENEQSTGAIQYISETKLQSSAHSINNDNLSDGVSAGHITESGVKVPESSSSAYLHDASLSPLSLDALSNSNEKSIHPSESFDSTAQIPRHISIISSASPKFANLEVEYDESASNLNSPASLVTFDPNGMTHNFTQEPDSITFSSKVVHAKPTDSYLSNLEHEDLHSNKPELQPDTAFVTEDDSSFNTEGFHSSEREREVSPQGHILPHDEPDREVQSFASTERPGEKISISEPKTVDQSKRVLSLNDESEEMLNDSPHFIQNQNKPTLVPTADFTNKYLNKNLENNISNDITHSFGLKSQDIEKSHHELDFPIEYQTQQSEIRPVTAVSPIKTSETAAVLPISQGMQSVSPSNVTKSNHPVSILRNTSSSVILPNPPQSIVNRSSEKITLFLSPEMLPKDFVPSELLPKDYVPPELLPKDYVPSENQSKDSVTSEMLPKDYVPTEMIPKEYVPLEKLPEDYIPPDMLPKDYIPSERLSKEHVKSDILPNDYVSPKLSTKDYLPLELLPKDYVPPEMLPKNFTTDEFEQGNDTDKNVNSTIAGVAVRTSVSVSLPLSKSPNSTADAPLNSAKELSNDSSKNTGRTTISIPVNTNNNGNIPSAITTDVPILSTTEATGVRIRKPKLRIISGDEPPTPRTRKPFLPSLQKPSTTSGPPVSIFKQARTRLNSITSSTTQKPFTQFSTIRIHYASRIPGMVPGGEMVFSVEPVSTTVATTTETEEPFSEEPFTGKTIGPVVPTEDNVTLLKVAGMIVVDNGLRWSEQLNNRLSPQYKEREKFVQSQLYRLFRTSPIAPQLWKIQIDGFSGKRNSKSVVIDFFLYLIKSHNEISPEQVMTVFHDKLMNNTFSRFTVDTNKTSFEFLNEELMRTTTPLPEEEHEPVIPQWAIAVIVVGAASLIFIVLFAAVAILGRHHVRRRYSNKLTDEDSDRPSEWESKMASAYENLAADTIYDAEDFHGDTYKKISVADAWGSHILWINSSGTTTPLTMDDPLDPVGRTAGQVATGHLPPEGFVRKFTE